MSRGKDKRGDRQMHRATCANCGENCEVPFRPSSDKPVYCSNCFKRDRSSGGGERGRQDRGRQDMYKATCADCGKNCEVPFRPSGDKPVYCSNCFGKGDSSGPRRSDRSSEKPDQSNKKHAEINAKLDKILSLLQRMNPKKEEESPKKAVAKKEAKKAAPKKAVKKAPAKKKAVKKAVIKKKGSK
ncbi:hypothetical protein KKG51_03035 [Patescibacteria group bacterium]|nr:hypothetical protein [Patescibacteria group bacterium]